MKLNLENLPVIHRNIASTIVFSSDGCLLMGRKDTKGGGVYFDSWHLPGGGVEAAEELIVAAARELREEVAGLDFADGDLEAAPGLRGRGATVKVLEDGKKVWCEMTFNYFRLASDRTAHELRGNLRPGSDFVELALFSPQQLSRFPTVPGGVEGRIVAGSLTATSILEG